MGPVIRDHGGFIDKYIGDAIMALFEKADDGVRAGLAMMDALDRFNAVTHGGADWRRSGSASASTPAR